MKTELFTLFDNNFNVHLPSLVHPDNFAGTVKGKAIAVHGNVVYIAAIRNVGEPSQHVVVVSVNIGTYLTNQISLEGIAYKEVAGLYVPTSAVTGLPEADPTIILTDYTGSDGPMANAAIVIRADLSALISVRMLPMTTDTDNGQFIDYVRKEQAHYVQ
jgi:hypothetical protein